MWHHRRSIRLRGYDYTDPGAYFVTICTRERAHLFDRVVDGEMALNEFGRIVREEWFRSAEMRGEIRLYPDEFVVMPNHIHGTVWIVDDVGATGRLPLQIPPDHPRGPAARSLASFIAGFKSAVTKRVNSLRGTRGTRVWQRNYYEHIIRTQRILHAIRRYIAETPLRWHLDRYNPDRVGDDEVARDPWRMMREHARPPPRGGRGERPFAPTTDDPEDQS